MAETGAAENGVDEIGAAAIGVTVLSGWGGIEKMSVAW